jgi:hypothetical protein
MATDRGTILFGNHPECIGGENHFHIMKQDASAVDLFFGSDENFVKLPRGTSDVVIGNGNNYNWQFGADGSLLFPDGAGIINNANSLSIQPASVAEEGAVFQISAGMSTGNIGGDLKLWAGMGADPGMFGSVDILGNVTVIRNELGQWEFGTDGRTTFPSATIPITSKGSIGDHAGQVAFDSDYIYYCTADYDGDNNIWKRVALDATSWDNTPPPPPPTLVSIEIAPDNSNVFTGNDTTVQFTATGTYSDASTADITMLVTWESTYGMTNYSIDSTGLLRLMEGETNSTTITATLNGITSSTGLTFA